jgi:hypothetical protein
MKKILTEEEKILKLLPKELRKLHGISLSSLYIETDKRMKNEFGYLYSDEQLREYLFDFVKLCKKFNSEHPIHIFCFFGGEDL